MVTRNAYLHFGLPGPVSQSPGASAQEPLDLPAEEDGEA
jgi:hypothetical protein